MQQYVLTLEAERNELQRGLDKQMALVRKLADEQGAADGVIEGAKRDVARLQEELMQCREDLVSQVRARSEKCVAACSVCRCDGGRQQTSAAVRDSSSEVLEELSCRWACAGGCMQRSSGVCSSHRDGDFATGTACGAVQQMHGA